MKQFLLTAMLLGGMGESAALAQSQLSGRVVDAESREPLPGASLMLKYTESATQSGSDGSFSLPVPSAPDTLVISLIGYREERLPVTPGQIELMQVRLEPDIATLERVVVNTGLYQIPRERATGSFTHIDDTLLSRSVTTNILDRLEGITSSLQFDRRHIDGENRYG
ncbi:MAG TPA: carboxypeptidase-like regulatory domain-containing protein, partial [Anseongella sp.]|nr:carboxypeptidase-like regulatory domain-containing protein [Anseongella sp.]